MPSIRFRAFGGGARGQLSGGPCGAASFSFSSPPPNRAGPSSNNLTLISLGVGEGGGREYYSMHTTHTYFTLARVLDRPMVFLNVSIYILCIHLYCTYHSYS